MFSNRRDFFIGIAVAGTAAACTRLKMREEESFGLTRVRLTMDTESLNKLRTSQESNIPFPTEVDINGVKYRGEMRNTGRSTIDAYKKSYEISLLDNNLYQGWKKIRLNAQASDKSMLKSSLGFDIFAAAGILVPSFEPVALYLNQEYLGLYYLLEPVDGDFFKRKRIQPKALYKAKYGNSDFSQNSLLNFEESYDVEIGSEAATDLRGLIERIHSSKPVSSISDILDVDQYLRYHAVAVALNHFDGFSNNFFILAEEERPLRFFPWDLDRLYENDSGHPFEANISIWGGNFLSSKLFTDPQFKQNYLTHLRQLIANQASAAALKTAVALKAERIKAAYHADRVLSATGDLSTHVDVLNSNIDQWMSALSAELARQP